MAAAEAGAEGAERCATAGRERKGWGGGFVAEKLVAEEGGGGGEEVGKVEVEGAWRWPPMARRRLRCCERQGVVVNVSDAERECVRAACQGPVHTMGGKEGGIMRIGGWVEQAFNVGRANGFPGILCPFHPLPSRKLRE